MYENRQVHAISRQRRVLQRSILEDARLNGGYAHLETHEVPAWVDELRESDLLHTLCEALKDADHNRQETLNGLLAELCRHGEDISQRKAIDLLQLLQAALTEYCTRQAQRMIERKDL